MKFRDCRMTLRILLLASALLLGVTCGLTACRGGEEPVDTSSTGAATGNATQPPAVGPETEGATTPAATEAATEAWTEEDTTPLLSGDDALLIESANRLVNGANAYYTDGTRGAYAIENKNVLATYPLSADAKRLMTLTSPAGGNYVTDTMDVFVKTTDGKVFFASDSEMTTRANIFRLGYYYYDVRLMDQDFNGDYVIEDEKEILLRSFKAGNDIGTPKLVDDVLTYTVLSGVDPNVYGNTSIDLSLYNAVQITMRSTISTELQIFPDVNGIGFTSANSTKVVMANDGAFHTYTIMLDESTLTDFEGKITRLRVDTNGMPGEVVEISSIKAVKLAEPAAPPVRLDRNLHVYSDKLHQTIHLAATDVADNVAEVGMITHISADTVAALVVKDKAGTHDTLDGVDWASAEYIAFDIKGVGIFGYILPADGKSGSMTVTLSDGVYTLTQTLSPEGNTIRPSNGNTANDFRMGMRLYTDRTHTFDAFLKEAEIERNPLTAENITVKDADGDTRFVGYDALRGSYTFALPGTASFNDSFFIYPNRHYNITFTVKGDEYARNLYVLTSAYTTNLECAALLDERQMMLPIPLEVGKNFSHEMEEPLFDKGDTPYGEVIFPVALAKGEERTLTVVNLYQTWGRFPLKQLSFIQFQMPYYHLSTGVTETNCISPYYVLGKNLQMLPDHRAWSAPFWHGEPQHTAGGHHFFLQYVDGEGNLIKSENVKNDVGSYGPTYADVTMEYLSDDGKIKATYSHAEVAQYDENRAYYTLTYEVLEDMTFENFARDFSFYSIRGFGEYSKVGYLNADNQSVIVDANRTSDPELLVLGDEYPYFDMFLMTTGNVDDYVNVSFLVKEATCTLDGVTSTAPLALTSRDSTLYLTLNKEALTLKKGDVVSITAIIMPWGHADMDYSGDTPDLLVRKARENSIINPVTATAEVGTVMETEFLPFIRSEKNTATFTLSGGANCMVVRVFGFDKLTVPVIEELVDGKWVVYEVSSAGTPDKSGYYSHYDGYNVYYDGDGTYSYSFVVDMGEDGASRTFRVSATADFAGWPDEGGQGGSTEEPEDLPLNVYLTPADLLDASASGSGFGDIEIAADQSYIRFYGSGQPEAYFTAYQDGKTPAGQYVVLRYRTANTGRTGVWCEVFSSTVSGSATGNGDFANTTGIICDGEWHVIVFDLVGFGLKNFEPNADGAYVPKFLRLDCLNSTYTAEEYMDIAYLGIHDNLDDVLALNSDLENILVTTGLHSDKHTVLETMKDAA